MNKRATWIAAAFLALSGPWICSAATYEIDPVHSEVGFKIRHMMVGKTAGKFTRFSGSFEYDGKNPKKWSARASIEAASIDTANSKRDDHLRSEDFFDVAKHPSLEFVSTDVKGGKGGKAKLMGKLTLHGVTKDVALDLELNGEGQDAQGKDRIGFTAKTKIDRRDFGITWNKTLDKGGFAVGNDVDITLEIEAVKK